MSGNIADTFYLPMSLGKKGVKLYTSFENADIIIASPLGLSASMGDDEENRRPLDFLSSIQLLIVDRVRFLFLQRNYSVDSIWGFRPKYSLCKTGRILMRCLAQ